MVDLFRRVLGFALASIASALRYDIVRAMRSNWFVHSFTLSPCDLRLADRVAWIKVHFINRYVGAFRCGSLLLHRSTEYCDGSCSQPRARRWGSDGFLMQPRIV